MSQGKYAAEVSRFKQSTQAEAIICVVVNGNRGSSLAIEIPLRHMAGSIAMLRDVLADFEKRFPVESRIADGIGFKAGSDKTFLREED